MQINYLLDDSLIPDDGSRSVIENFVTRAVDDSLKVTIYPDVHYKKGSHVVNGMLTESNYIYPSMLGVTNCGFNFGKIESARIDEIDIKSALENYSKVLKAYNWTYIYSENEVMDIFENYLNESLDEKRNEQLLRLVGLNNRDQLVGFAKKALKGRLFNFARKTLGTLGGGNHFFEIQRVEEAYEDKDIIDSYIYILHSDSISVGDQVALLFSNLSELNYLPIKKRIVKKMFYRLLQVRMLLKFPKCIFLDFNSVISLFFSSNPARKIDCKKPLGKLLLSYYHLASIFGKMNRDKIVAGLKYEFNKIDTTVKIVNFGSHSHDSINVETIEGENKIIQRNGVQHVADDEYFILPGALGTESYLMRNNTNNTVYNSTNHGVGRILDKHLAVSEFNDKDTLEKITKTGMSIYRVGSGKISEQDPSAFKNVETVIKTMENSGLGVRKARLSPIGSMKG